MIAGYWGRFQATNGSMETNKWDIMKSLHQGKNRWEVEIKRKRLFVILRAWFRHMEWWMADWTNKIVNFMKPKQRSCEEDLKQIYIMENEAMTKTSVDVCLRVSTRSKTSKVSMWDQNPNTQGVLCQKIERNEIRWAQEALAGFKSLYDMIKS